MNQKNSTPNDANNEARDPLLEALWQRVEGYGQAPPPGAWASIRQQLTPPTALPQPTWWHHLLPNLWSKLFVLGSLTAVLTVTLLALYHWPQDTKHLQLGLHLHSGHSATGPGRFVSPRLPHSPVAGGSRAVLPSGNSVQQPDRNGGLHPKLLRAAAPQPYVRPSVTVAKPDANGVVANPIFAPEAAIAKVKTGIGDEAIEPEFKQSQTRRAHINGTAIALRLTSTLIAADHVGAAKNQLTENRLALPKRLVPPIGRFQSKRTAEASRQMREHVATGIMLSGESIIKKKQGLLKKGHIISNARTNTVNQSTRLPVLSQAADSVGTDSLDRRQRSPNSFAVRSPDAMAHDEPFSKYTRTSNRAESWPVDALTIRAAAQTQSLERPLTLPVPDSNQVVPARPWHSRWALVAVAGPTLSYRTLGSLPEGGARSVVAQSERPALGYGAQVQVQRVLSGRWAVAAGLGYQEYATNLTLQIRTAHDSTFTYQTVNQRDTYRLLTLPVQFGYTLGRPHGRLTTAMLLGVEPAWYQGGRSTECNCLQRVYHSANDSPYRSWTLGASIGFDLRYQVSRNPASRLYWVVQPTGRYVLTPFERASAAENQSRHPFSVGVLTGLVLELR